ncbi:hypothetical protein ACJX0J_006400, partial [Zea mays]
LFWNSEVWFQIAMFYWTIYGLLNVCMYIDELASYARDTMIAGYMNHGHQMFKSIGVVTALIDAYSKAGFLDGLDTIAFTAAMFGINPVIGTETTGDSANVKTLEAKHHLCNDLAQQDYYGSLIEIYNK